MGSFQAGAELPPRSTLSAMNLPCPWCDEDFPVQVRLEFEGDRVLAVRVYQTDLEIGLLAHMYALPAA